MKAVTEHKTRKSRRHSFLIRLMAIAALVGLALLSLISSDKWTMQAQSACTYSQITFTTGVSNDHPPRMSYDGTRFVFMSRANITGRNPDGSQEIYLRDTITNLTIQVSDSIQNSAFPSISGDGRLIAFASFGDFTGSNSDLSEEIFLFEIATGQFTQLTHETGLSSYSTTPALNADGTRLVYTAHPILILRTI